MFLPFVRQTLRACAKGIVPLLVAVAAYLQAAGISQLIKGALIANARLAGGGRMSAPCSGAEAGRESAKSARSLLDRDPFDSTTPRPLDGRRASIDDRRSWEEAPACDGLKAVVVAAASPPAVSVAALSGDDETKAVLLHVGDAIADKTVELIEWNRVLLSDGSSLCQIRMFQSSKQVQVRRARPHSTTVSGPGAAPAPIASKIKKVGRNAFDVERAVVAQVLENPVEFMKAVRLVPEQKDGKTVGLRLVALPADSLLNVLGLQSGDELLTVNGFDLSDPPKALEAYARLKTADHLTLRVERRGKDVSLDYSIK